jgi:hypothetical protein
MLTPTQAAGTGAGGRRHSLGVAVHAPSRTAARRALAVVVLSATAVVPLAVGSGSANAADEAPVASLVDRTLTGREALDRLEGRIDDLARRNGLDRAVLRTALASDRTIRVDADARIFYVEPEATVAQRRGPDSTLDAAALAADAFTLHSLPGANRVIYLDFDGYFLSGTAWNKGKKTVTITPYDTDGNPSSFSAAEQAVVQETWQRVAEDYAPLGVDVTTQDPGVDAINRSSASDQNYGTRVVIDPTAWYYRSCGCGGVAYVGVYDNADNGRYQPAWVFTRGVGTGAKNIAEAASHEAGHNLGLSHDGAAGVGYYEGHGSWAPIMGVGYYRAISQWSKGEYAGANNTEDDFVVMTQNGVTVRAADHGTTFATASPLTVGQAATGVVAAQNDVDVFRVDLAAGSHTFTADAAAAGGNLDIRLSVFNSAQQQVGTWDPASGQTSPGTPTGLGASGTLDLAAGTYYVRVEGVGFGNPLNTGYSAYGSKGGFSLSVS